MLSHDLATTIVAERDRVIREAAHARRAPARPSAFSRLLGRLAIRVDGGGAVRPRRVESDPRVDVPRLSARARDSHGQGAC
jgi:hypothetical protein